MARFAAGHCRCVCGQQAKPVCAWLGDLFDSIGLGRNGGAEADDTAAPRKSRGRTKSASAAAAPSAVDEAEGDSEDDEVAVGGGGGNKVLLFAHHRKLMDQLETWLREAGVGHVRIDGSMVRLRCCGVRCSVCVRSRVYARARGCRTALACPSVSLLLAGRRGQGECQAALSERQAHAGGARVRHRRRAGTDSHGCEHW